MIINAVLHYITTIEGATNSAWPISHMTCTSSIPHPQRGSVSSSTQRGRKGPLKNAEEQALFRPMGPPHHSATLPSDLHFPPSALHGCAPRTELTGRLKGPGRGAVLFHCGSQGRLLLLQAPHPQWWSRRGSAGANLMELLQLPISKGSV